MRVQPALSDSPGPPVPSTDEGTSMQKGSGFRWAPSLGAWQAYINHRTLELARSFVACVDTPHPEVR